MKRTQTNDYQAPMLDAMEFDVEQGFSASYGDFGEAGGDFGSTDFGEF